MINLSGVQQCFVRIVQSSSCLGQRQKRKSRFTQSESFLRATRFISSEIPPSPSIIARKPTYTCHVRIRTHLRLRLRRLRYYGCVSRLEARMHFIFRRSARTLRGQADGKPVVRLIIARCNSGAVDRRPRNLFVYRVARKRRFSLTKT